MSVKEVSTVFNDDERYDLPDGWSWATIEELAEVIRGSSPRPAGDPRYFGGNAVPWITVGSITGDKNVYLDSTKEFLTEEGKSRSRYIEPDNKLNRSRLCSI